MAKPNSAVQATNAAPTETSRDGDPLVITLLDGTKINGTLKTYSKEKAFVAVQLNNQEKPKAIPLKNIKVMSFPTSHPIDNPQQQQKTKFIVSYKDGSVVRGYTLGCRPDEHGLHLFPALGPDEYIRTFSAFDGIHNYRIGEEEGVIPGRMAEGAGDDSFLASVVAQADADDGSVVFDDSGALAGDAADQIDLQSIVREYSVNNYAELEEALKRQQSMPNLRLGEILVAEELVTEQDIDQALILQKGEKKGTPIGEILIELELITKPDVQRALSKKLGIPVINLRDYQVEPDIITLVPREVAEKYNMMPVAIHGGAMVFATENPLDLDAHDAIQFHTKKGSEAVISSIVDIKWAIEFFYPSLFDDDDIEMGELSAMEADEDVSMSKDDENVADNVVVKLINKVIMDAYHQDASDIHIEPNPGKGKTVVRFRKDGTLLNYHELPAQYRNALISRIKIMSHLDISERRKPQDGKIDFKKFGPAKIELRVATIPTSGGMEDVVMRILAAGEPVPLDKLGLSRRNQEAVIKNIEKPYGLFLVCGPTGSGKTTTLHSILGYINTPERKIWTAEDPVEITQKGLRQVQVNPKINVTFAAAMRAFLRADPDVIMVGEMRDSETTSTGIEASLTGHLVFSTLHTNSAPESIVRLLDMGMDPFNFADALLGILAQRLGKRLCVDCKESYTPSEEELQELIREYCLEMPEVEGREKKIMEEWKKDFTDEEGKFTLCKPKGCPKCDDTGFRGRIGIHELLTASDAVKKAIIETRPVAEITELAIKEGMRTLKQDGIEKVLQGHTDITHVRKVCVK